MSTIAITRSTAKPRPRLARLASRVARNYYFGRTVKASVTIFVVTTLSFFIVHSMPGSPVEVYMQTLIGQYGMSAVDARNQAAALFTVNLDAPLWQQYLEYLSQLVRGNLGSSLLSPGTSVSSVMLAYLPWTLFSVGISAWFILGGQCVDSFGRRPWKFVASRDVRTAVSQCIKPVGTTLA